MQAHTKIAIQIHAQTTSSPGIKQLYILRKSFDFVIKVTYNMQNNINMRDIVLFGLNVESKVDIIMKASSTIMCRNAFISTHFPSMLCCENACLSKVEGHSI